MKMDEENRLLVFLCKEFQDQELRYNLASFDPYADCQSAHYSMLRAASKRDILSNVIFSGCIELDGKHGESMARGLLAKHKKIAWDNFIDDMVVKYNMPSEWKELDKNGYSPSYDPYIINKFWKMFREHRDNKSE